MATPITKRRSRRSERKQGQGKNLSAQYLAYITSSEWQLRKQEYYSNHEKVCTACGTDQHIQLHHLTYIRMRTELDADLMPLCDKHHRAVDRFRRKHLPLALSTDIMLEWVKAGEPRHFTHPLLKPARKKSKDLSTGIFDRKLDPAKKPQKRDKGQNPKRGVSGADVLNYSNRRSLKTDNGL